METLTGVDTMFAKVRRMATGTENRFRRDWLLQGANVYIHEWRVLWSLSSFSFRGKQQLGEKLDYRPFYFQISSATGSIYNSELSWDLLTECLYFLVGFNTVY